MMNIFHLFPPIDQVRAKERAEKLRRQALYVSTAIMEQLLLSLPLDDDDDVEEAPSRTDINFGGSPVGNLLEEEEEASAADCATQLEFDEEECVGGEVVTNEERLADRDIRLQIYLGLLNLACAMVTSSYTITLIVHHGVAMGYKHI